MVSRVKVTRPVWNPWLTGQSEGGGSGRVGSGGFEISRVGSGRVRRFPNLTGRVESGQEAFKILRVGPGQVNIPPNFRDPTRPDPTREVRPDPRKTLQFWIICFLRPPSLGEKRFFFLNRLAITALRFVFYSVIFYVRCRTKTAVVFR